MRRLLIIIFIVGAGAAAYFFFLSPEKKLQPLNLIAPDAAFILAVDEPVNSWKKISGSSSWKHLSRNSAFADLSRNVQYLDSILNRMEWLDMVGNQQVLISAHRVGNKFGYLFTLDLGKAAHLTTIKDYFNNFLGKGFRITNRSYNETDITELYDLSARQTIYFTFLENLMVTSFVPALVENTIDHHRSSASPQLSFLEVKDMVGYEGIIRAYVNYGIFDKYLSDLTTEDQYISSIKQSLDYGGFSFDLREDDLELSGFTNIRDSVDSYIRALHLSGKAGHEFLKMVPKNSTYFLSLGFDSFDLFIENLEKSLSADEQQAKIYKENREALEDFLKVNLDEHFVSWVDDEVALVQPRSKSSSGINEYVLLLKAKSAKDAEEGLTFICDQIRKKTPVKVKSITYKGYDIHYMAIKGFFQPFFGKLFNKFEKPYYSILGDWVVFSNHPQTLKEIIDTHENKQSLVDDERFMAFYKKQKSTTNTFIYLNTEQVFNDLEPLFETAQWDNMNKNREFITCFAQIGFQMAPETEKLFYSGIFISFEDPALRSQNELYLVVEEQNHEVHKNEEVKSWEESYLEELLITDKIIIPDLNAKEHIVNYENGKIRYSIDLKNGWKHGRFESFFENGEPQFKGRYKDDKKHGTWRVYNQEGKLLKKLDYDNGILQN